MIKPFFEVDKIKLFNEDILDCKSIQDESIDLIATEFGYASRIADLIRYMYS